MRELERQVWLNVLDRKWREHLYEMDYLREGIGLRAMAQRDPLVEYQREGAQMFDAMRDGFAEEVVGYLFNIDVQIPEAEQDTALNSDSAAKTPSHASLTIKGAQHNPQQLSYSAPSDNGEVTTVREGHDAYANVGRNESCPCGSGKKFKVCHGRNPQAR